MSRQELLKSMQTKMETAGIPFEEINVFGAIRINVHVRCVSRNTADKWAMFLAKIFNGSKVSINKTAWNAKENKGTSLLPTMREGFLISVIH